ncbi:MAG: hypothetical protein CMN76_20320 [Spirochaetaceae bacterium]|nr:hypothetical protein [Spirochaetaceae bacterium]|tara:strand:- start:69329 stop:69919 length:591 start_codon:yes stop_codon:yes gene_type:complete
MTTDENSQDYHNIFLVPWMLALVSPAMAVFTFVFGTMIYGGILDAIATGISIYTFIGTGIGGFGLYVHYEYIRSFWRLSNVVTVTGNKVRAKAPFSQPIELDLEEVHSIHRARFTIGVILEVLSPQGKFWFAVRMERAGELVELILSKTPNIEKVDLGSYPKKEYLWKKEPDWDIINAAIARAEENRKKKEQEQHS